MKTLTREEALRRCRIYDGTVKSVENAKNDDAQTFARYEQAYVEDFAQKKSELKYLSDLTEQFKQSPAYMAKALVPDADDTILGIVYERMKYWSGGIGDEASWADEFTDMVRRGYL